MDANESHGFGSSPVLAEGGTKIGITETGFNTLSLTYYGRTTSPYSYAASNWTLGSGIVGYSNMYVTDVSIEQDGVDIFRFTVDAKGLLGIQAVKRTISTKSQSYTTGPIILPGPTAVPQAQGTYLTLSCTFNYVSLFLPSTNIEPQDAVPPPGSSLPSPPANPFSSVPTTPIYNYPYGWLRRGLDIDNVNGAEVYLVKEEWDYVYEYMPG